MATKKAKFELFTRLQGLGFTYGEAVCLRRIEMTLHRWAELECGDENGRGIERDEETGKPYMTFEMPYAVVPCGVRGRYAVADKEAGALKRLDAIIDRRNGLLTGLTNDTVRKNTVIAYHQTDPRGCALYLLKRSDLPEGYFTVVDCGDGWSILPCYSGAKPYGCRLESRELAEAMALRQTLEANYSRGLAVCC